MTEDVSKRLLARKAEMEKQFDVLKKQRGTVIEQGKNLQRQLNEIEVRLTQMQGAYAELNIMLNPPEDLLTKEKKVPKEK